MDGARDPGAFYAAQQVLSALLEVGRGNIVLTSASASLCGKARFSPLAVGKFGCGRWRNRWRASSGLKGHTWLHTWS